MQVIEYVEFEKNNQKKAEAAGVDAENIELIKQRVKIASDEAKNIKKDLDEMAAQPKPQAEKQPV